MILKVTVARTQEWLEAERLAKGENIPDLIEVPVRITDLSLEVRKILLKMGCGRFPDEWNGRFDINYEFSLHSCYGHERPTVNDHAPSPRQIDAAIFASAARLEQKRLARQEQQRRKEEEERLAKEEAARKEAELNRARELLKDELQKAEQFRKDREILAYFLSHFGDDALQASLDVVADNDATARQIWKKKVEDASPYRIFSL